MEGGGRGGGEGGYQEERVLGAVEGGQFLVDLLWAEVIVGNDFDVVTAWG